MEINNKILKRLDEWQQSEGSLPELVEFYKHLLGIQTDIKAQVSVPQPSLSQAEVLERLRQGIPLLEWQALSLDWSALHNIFQKVAALAGGYYKAAAGDFEKLRDIASDTSLLQEATRAWYDGQPLSSLAATYSVNEELLAAVIHSAVKPFLTAYSEALSGLVDQEQWRRGYCPICGGKPDFASLDRERGARWLLCSRCDAQWLFQRLQCPYCGTQDQDALAYFTNGDGLYRLYVCQQCQSYLKTIDLRRTEAEILLPLERVLTLDMDRQGQEKGYRGGWSSTVLDA